MTRPIKFRAIKYSTIGGHMLEVLYFTLEELMRGKVHFAYPEHWAFSQFTGLFDKNGKEIYEGDIFKSGNGRFWEVCFGEWKYWENKQFTPMFGVYTRSEDISGTEAQLPLRPDAIDSIEIIGNIYENPELISK